METHLATAITFIYALTGITVIGLIVLFAIKLRHVAEEKRTARCMENYQDYFQYVQAYIEEEERLQLPPGTVTLAERRIIQKKLFELIERFNGAHREKLIMLCQDLGLVEHDLQRLRSWRKWTRIDAAYNLGTMRSPQAVPELLGLLRRSSYDPSIFIIARAIAKCAQDEGTLRELVKLMSGYQKSFHQLIADILSESQVDFIPLLISLLKEQDQELVKIALVGLAFHAEPGMEGPLANLSRSTDKEVRIKAIKLLCRDSRFLTKERINRFMSHADWEVRAICAKAIGDLGLQGYIPLLKKAVGDSNWWVCRNSAHSLAQLHVDGFVALCEILQENNESGKLEMAYHVIQEELEKGESMQSNLDVQLDYNHKLHVYQKLNQQKTAAMHALEM